MGFPDETIKSNTDNHAGVFQSIQKHKATAIRHFINGMPGWPRSTVIPGAVKRHPYGLQSNLTLKIKRSRLRRQRTFDTSEPVHQDDTQIPTRHFGIGMRSKRPPIKQKARIIGLSVGDSELRRCSTSKAHGACPSFNPIWLSRKYISRIPK